MPPHEATDSPTDSPHRLAQANRSPESHRRTDGRTDEEATTDSAHPPVPNAGGGVRKNEHIDEGNHPRPLTAAELEVLEFARETWHDPGRKATAILERFGHNVHRYQQRLNAVLTLPAAETYDPTLVRRLRARQAARRTLHQPTYGYNEQRSS